MYVCNSAVNIALMALHNVVNLYSHTVKATHMQYDLMHGCFQPTAI